jgi:hypothetical protein
MNISQIKTSLVLFDAISTIPSLGFAVAPGVRFWTRVEIQIYRM